MIGPKTHKLLSTLKGTDRLEARASDPACCLVKPYDCICGFINCKDVLASFGVVCQIKTQPQIGDFRLKNGKYPPTF